jgi:predicted nucleic acid-binding protein
MSIAMQLIEEFLKTGVELWEPPGLHPRAVELATDLRQNAVYDAHYLAFAESVDCDQWTADERFYRAAVAAHGRMKWLGNFEG